MENDAPREHDAATSPLPSDELAACYQEHGEPLRRFLTGVLKDGVLAQDIVQSVFVKFVEHGDEVHPARRKAWLFQVAYREALQWRRRQASGTRATREAFWQRPRPAPERPDGAANRAEEVARVRNALQELPLRERQVVQLRIYQGMTFAQIAQELDAPLGTVLGRMRSALKRLRKVLGEP